MVKLAKVESCMVVLSFPCCVNECYTLPRRKMEGIIERLFQGATVMQGLTPGIGQHAEMRKDLGCKQTSQPLEGCLPQAGVCCLQPVLTWICYA